MNRHDHDPCNGILQWGSDQQAFVELFDQSDTGISLMAASSIAVAPSERIQIQIAGTWLDAEVVHAANTASRTYLDLKWSSSSADTGR